MIAAVVTVGSPRAHVAALLAQGFRRGESSAVAADLRKLHETAVATVRRATLTLDAATCDRCVAAAERAQSAAMRAPEADRVAVMAHVIRTLLDEAPDAYCALDRRVRDVCERRYPSTAAQRDVAALIVEAVDAQVRR